MRGWRGQAYWTRGGRHGTCRYHQGRHGIHPLVRIDSDSRDGCRDRRRDRWPRCRRTRRRTGAGTEDAAGCPSHASGAGPAPGCPLAVSAARHRIHHLVLGGPRHASHLVDRRPLAADAGPRRAVPGAPGRGDHRPDRRGVAGPVRRDLSALAGRALDHELRSGGPRPEPDPVAGHCRRGERPRDPPTRRARAPSNRNDSARSWPSRA